MNRDACSVNLMRLPATHHVTHHALQLVFELCLTVSFVSLDYHMNEMMTYYIFFREIDELDALDTRNYTLSFYQSRATASGQIDLSYVAGDNCL